MQKELLYKFLMGLTSAEESNQVIHWINASEGNKKIFLEERRIHDFITLSLLEESPPDSWEEFRKKNNL